MKANLWSLSLIEVNFTHIAPPDTVQMYAKYHII